MQPIPKMLLAGLALVLMLGACSGKTTSSTTTTYSGTAASRPAATTAAVASQMVKMASSSDGAKVFSANCASCHQATGMGQPGAFPPLAGNPVVTGDPLKVAHIIKYGLKGVLLVNGKSYNGEMPAWKGTLNDGQIASVETYIRSSWGNHASAITTAQVTAVKQ